MLLLTNRSIYGPFLTNFKTKCCWLTLFHEPTHFLLFYEIFYLMKWKSSCRWGSNNIIIIQRYVVWHLSKWAIQPFVVIWWCVLWGLCSYSTLQVKPSSSQCYDTMYMYTIILIDIYTYTSTPLLGRVKANLCH